VQMLAENSHTRFLSELLLKNNGVFRTDSRYLETINCCSNCHDSIAKC